MQPYKLDVSIIIVNYNTITLLDNCLNSILAHTDGLLYEIIVIDNASIDGSPEMIRIKFPNVKLLASETNLGFGKANNLGVRNAIGEYLFFLNSDTILIENSIKILHDFCIKNALKLNIGVLGCVLVDDAITKSNSGGVFPTPLNDIWLYFVHFYKRVTRQTFLKRYDFAEPYQCIDMISGADMFMKKINFDEVCGFDEGFFLYYEETDLQKRLEYLGYKNYIISETKIIHLEGGSITSEKPSNFKRIVIQQSRNRYFKKHHLFGYFIYLLFETIINFLRVFNRNYTFKENKEFIKMNFKSYF